MTSIHNPLAQPSPGHESVGPTAHQADQDGGAAVVVPLAQEELAVEKRTVETGRVRVRKTVHERTQSIEEPLYTEEVDVERVRVNQFVDSPPAVRCEGDVWIVPLVEEVLVKRLVLREEIRIRRHRREIDPPEAQTLRYEQAHIERMAERGGSAETGAGDPRVESRD